MIGVAGYIYFCLLKSKDSLLNRFFFLLFLSFEQSAIFDGMVLFIVDMKQTVTNLTQTSISCRFIQNCLMPMRPPVVVKDRWKVSGARPREEWEGAIGLILFYLN